MDIPWFLRKHLSAMSFPPLPFIVDLFKTDKPLPEVYAVMIAMPKAVLLIRDQTTPIPVAAKRAVDAVTVVVAPSVLDESKEL